MKFAICRNKHILTTFDIADLFHGLLRFSLV